MQVEAGGTTPRVWMSDTETPDLPAPAGPLEEVKTEYTPVKTDGRFKPGSAWTGNKLGRPKGIKNRITTQRLLVEETLRDQLAVNAEALLAKAVIMAMNGDDKIMRVLLDKLLTTPKGDDGESAKDNHVTVIVRNLTTPTAAPPAPAAGKVRVISADESPIEGEIVS